MFYNNRNNTNQFMTLVISFISVFFIFQYRYRIINTILGTRWLRQLAVSAALQIPFIRDRFFSRLMPF